MLSTAAPVSAPKPLTPVDIFNEALGYVPLVHVPVADGQKALMIGPSTIPAAQIALRYPSFSEVVITGEVPSSAPRDPRVHLVPRLADLPPSWKADLITIAIANITPEILTAARAHSNQRTVVVVAVPAASQARQLKDLVRRFWPVVAPYREHLPEPAYFFLASDVGISRSARMIPAQSRRLTEKYVPALFTFAKDEYAMLFGGTP